MPGLGFRKAICRANFFHHRPFIMRALVLAIFIPLITHPLSAESNKAAIRYEEEMWDPQILRTLIEGPGYLKPELEFNLTPPPSNNSPETRAELKALRHYQATARDEATVNKINIEARTGNFAETFLEDETIPPTLAKAAYHLLKLADDESRYFIVKYKKRFARPRPSQLAPDLKLVVPNPGHAAYPSGHATQSWLMARILSLLDPQHQQAYLAYAKAIAKRREIAGVHYPSDSTAGQKLADGLLKELKKLPAFQEELRESFKKYKQN